VAYLANDISKIRLNECYFPCRVVGAKQTCLKDFKKEILQYFIEDK
jgi:hypothetical protein